MPRRPGTQEPTGADAALSGWRRGQFENGRSRMGGGWAGRGWAGRNRAGRGGVGRGWVGRAGLARSWAMRPRLAGTWLTRAAGPRPARAGSRVAAAAPVGPGLAVPGRAGPGRARAGLRGRRLAGLELAGLVGGLAGLGEEGRGLAGQSLPGLAMAQPQLVWPGQVRPMRAAGLGRIDSDQPRGRGDRKQPSDQHHADDQCPAIGSLAARQPGVLGPRLIVGLGADPDQPERPGILGHVGELGRRRRGGAGLEGRPGLVRGQRDRRGLIRLGLIQLGLIRLSLIRFSLIRLSLIRLGLGGDDGERTWMYRDGRGDRSLSRPGASFGRASFGRASLGSCQPRSCQPRPFQPRLWPCRPPLRQRWSRSPRRNACRTATSR